MTRVCIDSSFAMAWLSYGRHTATANALMREWSEGGTELLGPPVFFGDLMSLLRREVLLGRMLPDEGEEAFSICVDIPIRIVDGQEVYRAAWSISKEFGLPVCYDAQYLAVAQLHGCEFWTGDRALASAMRGRLSWVRWLGEYDRGSAESHDTPRQETPRLDGHPGLWRRIQ